MGLDRQMDVNRDPTPSQALSAAVQIAGSQSALGRVLGVSQRAVWRWVSEGKHLPPQHVLAVEAATGIPKEQLRPDIYPPHEQQDNPVSRSGDLDRAQ